MYMYVQILNISPFCKYNPNSIFNHRQVPTYRYFYIMCSRLSNIFLRYLFSKYFLLTDRSVKNLIINVHIKQYVNKFKHNFQFSQYIFIIIIYLLNNLYSISLHFWCIRINVFRHVFGKDQIEILLDTKHSSYLNFKAQSRITIFICFILSTAVLILKSTNVIKRYQIVADVIKLSRVNQILLSFVRKINITLTVAILVIVPPYNTL